MSIYEPTALMFAIVVGFVLLAVLFKNIRLVALGGLTLILVLLMLKIIYFETPVIIAVALLVFLTIAGDSLVSTAENLENLDLPIPGELSEKDKEAIKKAYADQFAPEGCFIVVNHNLVNQWIDTIDPDLRDRWFILPDRDYQIWIYGADTIEDYYVGDEHPTIEQQLKDVVDNGMIWVKVKVPQFDRPVWVHVKATLHEMSWWFDPVRECVYRIGGDRITCHPEIDWMEVLT